MRSISEHSLSHEITSTKTASRADSQNWVLFATYNIAIFMRVNMSYKECKSCGFKTNADYNAAKNIATSGIEDIIKHELYKKGDI